MDCSVTGEAQGSGYLGHYVLVFGYDDARAAFLVRDPASSSPLVHINDAQLDSARTCFGTDEDLLFVPLTGSSPLLCV